MVEGNHESSFEALGESGAGVDSGALEAEPAKSESVFDGSDH